MSTPKHIFFEEGRLRFFSPLNGSRRELFAACIRALYSVLHGPNANHSSNLSKQEFKDLLVPVILDYEKDVQADVLDEMTEDRDPQQFSTKLMKLLIQEGWIEQYADRQGLITAFRFTRHGKVFAEAFWALDRPSRSRQRNMRACRNSLRATSAGHGDAHDLLDAYEASERVIQDLSESIEQLQQRVRAALSAGSLHDQWDSFIDFIERARVDLVKQMTVDSAVLNRHDIRLHLETIRNSKGTDKYARLQAHLLDEAKWLANENTGGDPIEWLLERIEDLVCTAYDKKLPSLMRLMDSYFKRITGLLQQTMLMKTGANRKVFTSVVERVRNLEGPDQDKMLEKIGEHLALCNVRLLDPSAFRMKEFVRREKASASAITPRPSREARMLAAMRIAGNEAFHLTNAQILDSIKGQLEATGNGVIRLSDLPAESARDVLTILRGVESVRGAVKSGLTVHRTNSRFDSGLHQSTDYEIRSA